MNPWKHIDFLERRCAHLKRRVEQGEAEGKDLSFDKEEIAALEFVTKLIRLVLDFLRNERSKQG